MQPPSLLLLVGFLTCVVSSPATDSDNGQPAGWRPAPSVEDYPYGDPRRCLDAAERNGRKLERFEVLPGFGWDNLRNVNEGQVVTFNYSQCRTTDDGRFLLPDSVSAVPIKASRVEVFAELIDHWMNWTSSTSRSINVDAGLSLEKFSIGGKFSYDFQDVKSKQIRDKSLTTRTQLRYVRYVVQLQPDTPLHPSFKNRVLAIAAARELNQREQARYLSQLLVRDFGTHVVTKADAGAALEQVDQVLQDWVSTQTDHKTDILVAAAITLFRVFGMSTSYETKTDQKFVNSYLTSRTSSSVLAKGGPEVLASNSTPSMWASKVDGDLVAMDRSGDPLSYVITESTFPELPLSTLTEVRDQIQEAVETYYSFNHIPGCLDPASSNFAPAANVDDGTCKPPPTNLTFGGVFQTCTMQAASNNGDLCGNLTQVNPLTGDFSCPESYQAVKLHSGSTSSSRSEHVCHSYWIFWTKCHDNHYRSEATYNMFWCVATGPVPQDSGYLFGGVFTSKVDNPLTRGASCPSNFFALKIGSQSDLRVCVSDDYEFGADLALPFAGFISCMAGNPLAVAAKSGSSHVQGQSKGKAEGSSSKAKPHGNLRQFFRNEASEWPMRCPDGYSRHLATVDQGCQVNYCVQTGSMGAPVLPPIKRPPFVSAPPLAAPAADNLIIFDPLTHTWKRNRAATEMMAMTPAAEVPKPSSSGTDTSSSMSPGVAAGISVGATLGCVILATVAVVAVRARRRRNMSGYRRLQNPLLDPQADYGSVTSADRPASSVTVTAVENE